MIEKLMHHERCVVLDGESYDIRTDFKVWAEIESLIYCSDEDEKTRLAKILALAYPILPHNPILAFEAIVSFYCGTDKCAEGEEKAGGGTHTAVPLCCVKQDFAYIYAAFLSEFGIDLTKTRLHWWRFKALLGALGENTMFAKIVGYRAADLAEIRDKAQRRHYEKMKKRFALRLCITDEEKATRLADAIGELF